MCEDSASMHRDVSLSRIQGAALPGEGADGDGGARRKKEHVNDANASSNTSMFSNGRKKAKIDVLKRYFESKVRKSISFRTKIVNTQDFE